MTKPSTGAVVRETDICVRYLLHCIEESLEVNGAAIDASPSLTTCS